MLLKHTETDIHVSNAYTSFTTNICILSSSKNYTNTMKRNIKNNSVYNDGRKPFRM